jgi:hypothetical protein
MIHLLVIDWYVAGRHTRRRLAVQRGMSVVERFSSTFERREWIVDSNVGHSKEELLGVPAQLALITEEREPGELVDLLRVAVPYDESERIGIEAGEDRLAGP